MPSNSGPKRTKQEREKARIDTAKLDLLGYSTTQIAKVMRVSQPQIVYDLKKVHAEYGKTRLQEKSALIYEKLLQYRHIMVESHEAWERSKIPSEEVTIEEVPTQICPACKGQQKVLATPNSSLKIWCRICKGTGETGGGQKIIKTTKQRDGDPRFLQQFEKAINEIRELLGLDEPKKQAIKMDARVDTTVQTLDWTELLKPAAKGSDLIAAEIARIETTALGEVPIPKQLPNGFKELENKDTDNGDKPASA